MSNNIDNLPRAILRIDDRAVYVAYEPSTPGEYYMKAYYLGDAGATPAHIMADLPEWKPAHDRVFRNKINRLAVGDSFIIGAPHFGARRLASLNIDI